MAEPSLCSGLCLIRSDPWGDYSKRQCKVTEAKGVYNRLDAQMLPQQFVDHLGIRLALGLLHDLAHEEAENAVASLPELLGRSWVGLDDGGDHRLQLARVGDLSHPPVRDDGGGISSGLHHE